MVINAGTCGFINTELCQMLIMVVFFQYGASVIYRVTSQRSQSRHVLHLLFELKYAIARVKTTSHVRLGQWGGNSRNAEVFALYWLESTVYQPILWAASKERKRKDTWKSLRARVRRRLRPQRTIKPRSQASALIERNCERRAHITLHHSSRDPLAIYQHVI